MKTYTFLIFIIFLGFNMTGIAQDFSLDQVKSEIEEISSKEQEAFKNGDCETVMELMSDNITFYANGTPSPPKAMIEKFCNNIPRPFPELNDGDLKIYPLSSNSAYSVKTLEYHKDENTRIRKIVTKIWNRIEGNWKMAHLQSTVKEILIK
ncbi:nuclear transport factor 2 family protein [Marinigracilibium pacificum]|uniref:DUF4440 domain-containing protein n=1 Tax=Marinigracilibium pacificum TaxID=2729599 RepID=A0A848J013_9BACT|nr:hypothetical protein [Marinigracilibium pacificum]NMM47814.1 hypothetical protein [Marinigracilibium pacificum]